MMRKLPRIICLLMAAACLLAGSAADALGQTRQWKFRVLLDDAVIGYHSFTLQGDNTRRELRSEARFDVKLLFISAYRYQHEAVEQWNGDCLQRLHARTNDDGKTSAVEGELVSRRLAVTSDNGRRDYGECVMTFAYWNPAILRQTQLLNPQTGQYEAVRITAMKEEQLLVNDRPLPARRYRIEGPANPIELWYSADGDWLQLASQVKGGRTLKYLREP